MPLVYDIPPNAGALRQGEILANIYEHAPNHLSGEMPPGQPIQFTSYPHPRVIVMNPDCDLEWDYNARFNKPNEAKLISHILLCDVLDRQHTKSQAPQGSTLWRQVEQNSNGRFHRLPPASIGDPAISEMDELYFDFKKVFGIPVANMYRAIEANQIERVAIVPPIYLHDLIQRFYAFLSRVALPD